MESYFSGHRSRLADAASLEEKLLTVNAESLLFTDAFINIFLTNMGFRK
jgi:hypothetical protein